MRYKSMSIMREFASYEDVYSDIRPLDLVVFRGTDFVSDAISLIQENTVGSGEFTHVGLIVTKELLPFVPLKDKTFYVWESTMSIEYPGSGETTPDIISGKGRFGVQIRNFEDVIKTYTQSEGAKVALCRLKKNPWENQRISEGPYKGSREDLETTQKRREIIIERLQDIHKRYGRAIYNINFFDLLASVCKCLRAPRERLHTYYIKSYEIITDTDIEHDDQKRLFCSELVALIYKSIGVLPDFMEVQDVAPMDLVGYDKDYQYDITEHPIYLSP